MGVIEDFLYQGTFALLQSRISLNNSEQLQHRDRGRVLEAQTLCNGSYQGGGWLITILLSATVRSDGYFKLQPDVYIEQTETQRNTYRLAFQLTCRPSTKT